MASLPTKIIDKLRELAPEGETVIAVLEVAQSVTGLGGTSAAEALKLLEAALKSLETGSHDPVTHEQILQRVAQLHDDAATEREREDAELAALGGPPPSTGAA
jgi:hypothetical protein